MGGVDLFDQLVNYYSFAKRSARWTRKTLFYLLQICLLNAYILYMKYGQPHPHRRRKLTLREFHQEIADTLLYFNLDDWPDDNTRIPHAPSLPVDARQDKLPTPSPPDSPTADDPAMAPASPDVPDAPPQVPLASPDVPPAPPQVPASPDVPSTPPQVPAAASPDVPLAAPGPFATPTRLVRDPVARLDRTLSHKPELITGPPGKRLQRKCRVCFKVGRRVDSRYECTICKVALCIKRECFKRYHTTTVYWRSPGTEAGDEGPQ